ncbi:MAG: PAS domain S-box protein [Sterolibacterium sp.]|nr:PAS domain S-box protein [Sterolibacterium sp.]
MKRRSYGIRQYVAWITLVPLLIMAASLELFFLHAQFTEMGNDLFARGQSIARQLAASSEYGVFSNNRTFLASVAKGALQEADVKTVILLNSAAEVIAASGEMSSQANSFPRLVNREIPILDNGTTLLLYQPILSTQIALEEAEVGHAPQQIGAVVIEMSWQRTNSLKAGLFWLTISATTVFLIITLYLVYLASSSIINPIRKLSGAVDAIGAGELNTRVTTSSRVSELTALGNGINHMATELQHERATQLATHEQMDQLNRNLEQTVGERTRELSTSLNLLRNQKEELQESKNRLKATLDAIPDNLYEVGLDGHIYAYHVRQSDLLLFPPDRFLGKTFYEFLPPEVARVCLAAVQEAAEKGCSSSKEHPIKLPQGEFWFELSVASMPESADQGRRFLCLVHHVTDRVRSRQNMLAAERRYFSLFVNASDAIMITDSNGIIEDINNSFTSQFGYEKNEICGTFIEELHPAEELVSIRRSFAATAGGFQPHPLLTILSRKDGLRIEVEIRASMVEISGQKVIQGIFIDLTERKRQEQLRIEKEKTHLDTLVREVHHRIKNNLQSVAGLLQRELGKFMELNPRLETAVSQVNAIAVVHGLQGTNPGEAIRLYDSVQSICRTISDLSQRPVLLHVEQGESAIGRIEIEKDEAVSVALILNELILNAIKHSPQDSSAPQVSLNAFGNDVLIAIGNTTAVKPDFNIDTGKGVGTGLSLVRSLLPEQGAQLAYALDAENYFVAAFKLSPPVVVVVHQMELG